MSVLPIVRPHFPRLGTFSKAFSDTLDNGLVTNNGPWVRQFEQQLTAIMDVPTLAFNTGMSALTTMLMAADVAGGEVICPSFTFAATPHAIRLAGATPVFADIDPDTLCLDPDDAERRITNKTSAGLGVDPYGICCDYERIAAVCYRYKLWALFDSAPAFGSLVDGRLTGGHGHAQVFSFHTTKPFATMEGGALCSDSGPLMEDAARIRNFGQNDHGDCYEVGINGKMTEVCALIGIKQLDSWQEVASSRVESASRLRRALGGIPGLTVTRAPLGQSPIWAYRPVLIDEAKFGMSRDAVVDGLHRRGIAARKYYTACHKLSVYNSGQSLPVTERIAAQVIALPVYHQMLDGEIERIVGAFHAMRTVNQREQRL